MLQVENLKKKYYLGDKKDGTVIFYSWLRQYVKKEFVVLNIGAGQTADRRVRSLKGEVNQVIGVDISNEVLENKDLDRALVIEKDKIPFPNNYFDLCFSDFVMEHIDDPRAFLKEVYRVLKPGSSFFFRTPNKHHYVSFIGRMTPFWFHRLVANRVRGLPQDAHEPHPTFYRFNTKNDINKYSFECCFKNIELRFIEAEPSYLVFHPIPFILGVVYERLVNKYSFCSGIRANILGRLEK